MVLKLAGQLIGQRLGVQAGGLGAEERQSGDGGQGRQRQRIRSFDIETSSSQGDNNIRPTAILNWRSTFEEIFPHEKEASAESSSHERFALPYKFQPRLRVSDAARFALSTFLRIFLGSALFGAWGALTLLAWTSIGNVYLRTAAVIPMFALFLGCWPG